MHIHIVHVVTSHDTSVRIYMIFSKSLCVYSCIFIRTMYLHLSNKDRRGTSLLRTSISSQLTLTQSHIHSTSHLSTSNLLNITSDTRFVTAGEWPKAAVIQQRVLHTKRSLKHSMQKVMSMIDIYINNI